MGFPVQNNYSILRALAFGNGRRYNRQSETIQIEREEYSNIRKALEPFNLFAFVIHDPAQHPEFHRNFSTLFERLDHSTGEHLLFFALTDPPARWTERASQRAYYRELSTFYSQQGDLFNSPIITEDKGETAFTLATTLNIPAEMLPVIVVTNDFRNNDFRWFRTDTFCVERQLNELGFLAYDCPEVKHNWQIAEQFFNQFDDKFDLCNASEVQNTTESLAKALSDALSFMVISGHNNDYQQNNAITQAKNAMNGLQRTLSSFKRIHNRSRYPIADTDIFDQLNLNIVNFLAILNRSRNNNLHDFLPINQEFLEPDSFQMMKTAKKVLDLFSNRNWNLQRILGEPETYDYTSVAICLTKLFEKEMNLSMVHWIRKELGIHTPQYFNKYEPYVTASYIPDNLGLLRPSLINFNGNKGKKWIAPGIGQSKLSFASMRLKSNHFQNFTYLSSSIIDNFLPKWDQLANIRNRVAHTELVDIEAVNNIRRLLNDINSLGVFQQTHQMKVDYRTV